VKPQNVIISETDSRAKLIDMGAAADLRVGINYVPNEFLLDPRYAPPQQYIMSTQVRLLSGLMPPWTASGAMRTMPDSLVACLAKGFQVWWPRIRGEDADIR
jgi:hypothetical protein